MGEPFLIFPESMKENNLIGPGMIVDIPDQLSDMPFYTINAKKPNFSGELLTIILSPNPITTLVIGRTIICKMRMHWSLWNPVPR